MDKKEINQTLAVVNLKLRPTVNPKTTPRVYPYVSQWCIKTGLTNTRKPTEEEESLEKMIFKYLWCVKHQGRPHPK